VSDCVKSIVDRALVIEVPEGDLCEHLASYDSDGDSVMESSDLVKYADAVSEEASREYFHSFIVSSFRHCGVITAKQEKALFHYFDLYNRIHDLDDIIIEGSYQFGKSWKESHTDKWGSELEFEPEYWEKSVLPIIEDGGLFSNHFGLDIHEDFLFKPSDLKLRGLGYQLSLSLYKTLEELGSVEKYSFAGGCTSSKAENEADLTSVPAMLQKSAQEMIESYNRIEEFLDNYDEIECEGKGCPEKDEFQLHNLVKFREKPPEEKE